MTELKHFSPATDRNIDWYFVDATALAMLDKARELAGIPFNISSNHRTHAQDMKLAGFTGAHTSTPCSAFDITFHDVAGAKEWVKDLEAKGWNFGKGMSAVNFNKLSALKLTDEIKCDAVRILLACRDAGFCRVGINLKNLHCHIDNDTKYPHPAFFME